MDCAHDRSRHQESSANRWRLIRRKDCILSSLAQIRQTARIGDTMGAWRMFEAAGLLGSADPDVLSLRGRLLKDRALKATEHQRAHLFEEAEQTYLRAAGDRRATYPLINAATIALLNGKVDQARNLARRTMALLASGEHEPETAYWLDATWAEAHLLLGRMAESRGALEKAIAGTPAAWEDHAATIRQLRFILGELGEAVDRFDDLAPPASLHFRGLIDLPSDEGAVRALVAATLDDIKPGFVFGALAAGADILVAEMAIERGAQLHVVLPASVETFRETSVTPFGSGWAERFDALLDAAEIVETLADRSSLSRAAIALGDEIAMGLTIRNARSLASRPLALRLRRPTDSASGAEAAWRRRGWPIVDLTVDRPEAGPSSLAAGLKRIMLASSRPFPSIFPSTRGPDGMRVIRLDNLEVAVDTAIAILLADPETCIGLVNDVVDDAGQEEGDLARVAALLARAGQRGSICAAAPGALAIDLWAPNHPFKAAGEVVTPFGDIPVSVCSPLPLG